MSPEGREFLYKYGQQARVEKENEKAKRVASAPKNWGTPSNKVRATTSVWRK